MSEILSNNNANRLDDGKLRYDLIPPYALMMLAKVYTAGAEKYEDHNWEKGMEWNRMLGSLMRHTEQFRSGIDLDEETNLPHMIHAAFNALGLVEYMRTHPELDNRNYVKNNAILSNKDFEM